MRRRCRCTRVRGRPDRSDARALRAEASSSLRRIGAILVEPRTPRTAARVIFGLAAPARLGKTGCGHARRRACATESRSGAAGSARALILAVNPSLRDRAIDGAFVVALAGVAWLAWQRRGRRTRSGATRNRCGGQPNRCAPNPRMGSLIERGTPSPSFRKAATTATRTTEVSANTDAFDGPLLEPQVAIFRRGIRAIRTGRPATGAPVWRESPNTYDPSIPRSRRAGRQFA